MSLHPTLRPVLQIIAEGGTLSEAQAEATMDTMLRGEASPEAVAGLLMGLRAR
ncbi:MAG: anthranilate phosphoribosyltransferase, partial [Demequina sp.]